jgi:hypothetical protein
MASVLVCGGLLYAKGKDDAGRTVVNANISSHAKDLV